jgi:hypothetical protein
MSDYKGLERAGRREAAGHKARHGMRVVGRSVKLLARVSAEQAAKRAVR